MKCQSNLLGKISQIFQNVICRIFHHTRICRYFFLFFFQETGLTFFFYIFQENRVDIFFFHIFFRKQI